MGQEFLTKKDDSPHKSYTEVFYEQLPFYLAIGMSYTEYFEGDSLLPKYFREAYRIKREVDDYDAWLQGVYVYQAVDCAIYNNPPLMKRGKEPRQYFKEPFSMQGKENKHEPTEEEIAMKKKEEEARFSVWLDNFVNAYKDI